jgi:hypothetical protein
VEHLVVAGPLQARPILIQAQTTLISAGKGISWPAMVGDRDGRYFRLIAGRGTSAIDERPLTERAEPRREASTWPRE